jgi:hypothetical protein
MEHSVQDNDPVDTANRNGARESIFFGATLTFPSTDEKLAVRVRNISSGGMMVDCTLGGAIGDVVIADIKNVGKVKGRIAWTVPPRMGIAFDHSINASLARVKV